MHLLKTTGTLAALALFCLPAVAWPADDAAASAKKLADAAMFLPPAQREEVRHKALAIILLAEYGRLLPSGLSPGQWEILENIFLEGRFEDSVRRKQADAMPPADTVSFDGGRLDGGGFSRIDNIIGTNGSPIALDRRLPTRLVPLNPGEEERLHRAASAFTANPAAAGIRERADALYRARLDNRMAGDGIFYRPYAGRTDDLYYRLVQNNPGPASEMNFYAIAESLPARRYHPITGIGSPALVPSPWFSVSEILSGGGLLAVESFKSRSPHADVRNPFSGFAARLLPFLGPGMENSRSGGELNVSKDVIRRAIESPHRFTPKPVEQIFTDPSHFFGCLVPQFIRVARRMTRAEIAEEYRKIDFETPLPDVPDEPAGNEVLVNPSKLTKAEFFQELPGILELDSAPKYNPDAALFADSPDMSGSQPVRTAPGARQPSVTTDIVLVQSLPGPGPQEVVAAPPASTPPPSAPLPSPMPLVASIPSLSPPAMEVEPAATPAAEPPSTPPASLFSSDGLSVVEQASRLLFSPQAGDRDGRPTFQPPLKFVPFPSGPLPTDHIAPAAPPAPPEILPEKAVASASLPPLPAAHYLAVVTPDISASGKYLGDIAASDAVLSKNAASLNRTNCYLQWIKAALDPVEAYLDRSPGLAQAQKAGLQAATSAAGNELNSLLENRQSLGKEREQLLSERSRLRSLIEGEPLRLTTSKLDALLGRHVEVHQVVAQETSRNPERSLKFSAVLPKSNLRVCFASNQ
jgi:hypothetical protein